MRAWLATLRSAVLQLTGQSAFPVSPAGRKTAYIANSSAPKRLGRYEILGTVGRWKGGWLYHGRWGPAGDVLVKALSPAAADCQELRARFCREARIAAVLNHPNIIRVWEHGEHEGTWFTAFDRLDGEPLSHVMHRGIALRHGVPVVLQVLEGLKAIHGRGIVLRDLSPSSAHVCPGGRAVITDLWLAKEVSVEGLTNSAAGRTRPFYTAPEQVRGHDVDRRCDLFSVGCVLYQMVVGRPPFAGQSVTEVSLAVINDEPDWQAIPSESGWQRLRTVIGRALRKDPANRFPDAAAMRSALELALEDLGGDAEWLAPSTPAIAPLKPN